MTTAPQTLIAANEPRTVTISIPGRPMGANQLPKSWQARERHRRYWQDAAHYAWLEADRPTFDVPVEISIVAVFGRGGRRDPSNYGGAGSVKFILDALTRAGMWPDDSQRWMNQGSVETVYRRGEWAIELTITERGDA